MGLAFNEFLQELQTMGPKYVETVRTIGLVNVMWSGNSTGDPVTPAHEVTMVEATPSVSAAI